VQENLEFAARLRPSADSPPWRLEQVINLLDLREVIGKYPSQLSGGNYQRAALAQVLAVNPDLLLLDEPASAADPSNRAAVVNALHELRSARSEAGHLPLTVVQVTHDVENAARASDALLVMTWGREGTRAIRHRFSIASSDSQASRIERSRLRQAIDLLCSPSEC
jgi:putative spermidine/putrescine transport system ATP-binding protein